MIWKWADRKQDHFVTFHSHEARLAALEADMHELSDDLLAYLEADLAAPWAVPAKRLSDTLRKIIKSREAIK